ncbi:MAG: PqqD family protein [Candidatus Latescibacteria bacterium]|nr:PqqD family protein [Candidatus Latescibacterota bacterium]
MKIVIDKDRITWRRLKDEFVLMHLDSGSYYSLNETGRIIWQGLVDDRPYAAIVADVVEEFEVEEKTAEADFEKLVNDLAGQGLVDLVEE